MHRLQNPCSFDLPTPLTPTELVTTSKLTDFVVEWRRLEAIEAAKRRVVDTHPRVIALYARQAEAYHVMSHAGFDLHSAVAAQDVPPTLRFTFIWKAAKVDFLRATRAVHDLPALCALRRAVRAVEAHCLPMELEVKEWEESFGSLLEWEKWELTRRASSGEVAAA
ncbi:hypothetical protein B0A49_01028 [Cryomyces minteri]|uniref:Uncharacterized protein n=1 Tax=Cryomyces minteri TaxID=331657 RepID=A0A4U0XV86_9PEZI|nr:hypothetical protein B0A49_01028 [Cryomyces minteri]